MYPIVTRTEPGRKSPTTGQWSVVACLVLAAAAMPAGAQTAGSPHGDLAIECSDCHTVEGWKPLREPLRFDHGSTRFPLAGAHAGRRRSPSPRG